MSNSRIYKPGAAVSAASVAPKDKDEANPFPIHCLPESVAAMARAITETERTPAALAGVCGLGFLSAAIGRGLQIKSGNSRFTRANLYLLASAESGSGKSETYRHFSAPLHEFEAELVERWKAHGLPGLAAEKDILEAEIAKLKKEAGSAGAGQERAEIKTQLEQKKAELSKVEAQLHAPALTVEDVTTEKLACLLAANGETLASLSSDAGTVVNNLLGRYNSLGRTDESIYLKAFSGDFCRVDRQKNAEPILLKSPCLAALWFTQPDKVETLLGEKSLTDGGLIPRLLICHTNAEPRLISDECTAEIPTAVSRAYRQVIRDLLEAYRLADEARTITPSPEALALLNSHFNEIVKRRLGDLRDVTTFAARWNEQAWRIAVCLHAGEWRAQAHEHELELDTATRAIEIAEWFAEQQLEILSGGREKATRELHIKVLELLADKPDGIRGSDVYRARLTRDSKAAHSLLAKLEAEGLLAGKDSQPEGGGHKTRLYTKGRK